MLNSEISTQLLARALNRIAKEQHLNNFSGTQICLLKITKTWNHNNKWTRPSSHSYSRYNAKDSGSDIWK